MEEYGELLNSYQGLIGVNFDIDCFRLIMGGNMNILNEKISGFIKILQQLLLPAVNLLIPNFYLIKVKLLKTFCWFYVSLKDISIGSFVKLFFNEILKRFSEK